MLRNQLINQIDNVYSIDNPIPQSFFDRALDFGQEGRTRAADYKNAILNMDDNELAEKVLADTGSSGFLAKAPTLSFRLLQGVCSYFGITDAQISEKWEEYCKTLTPYSALPKKYQFEIQAMRALLDIKLHLSNQYNQDEGIELASIRKTR